MSNHTYDAIIVGSGPAGSSAAYDLASAGADVLVLDHKAFPRTKACAGALTIKALRALRFSIAPVIRTVATDFIAGRGLGRQERFHCARPVAVLTLRAELDDFTLNIALRRGAVFKKIGRIEEIKETATNVIIRTDEDELRSRFLIGADGANSSVRRLCGEFPELRLGLAIEAQVSDPGASDSSLTFDFGIVPQGYGWIFQKGDHYNVGVYTYDGKVPVFTRHLRSYVAARLGRRDCEHIVGHSIGTGGWRYRPMRRRVLLAGDAAGLCDPLLGEGIYYAIRSGQVAAQAIIHGCKNEELALPTFQNGLRGLQLDLYIAYGLARWFYPHLGICYATMKSPLLRYSLMKGFSLGIPWRGMLRRFLWFPFQPMSAVPTIEEILGKEWIA